jgi:N utilization substance protein A
MRGNRIKNITSELAGERIDIVRWSDDPLVLIPNALQPAEAEQVLLCDMIGRAIVLVREDQLSQAIGRHGQNVRLASKLCGWDIEIMTADELEDQIQRAVAGYMELEGMTEDLASRLVEQGYLSYDDLSVIEPDALMEMGDMTAEQVDALVAQAEDRALEAEKAAEEQKRLRREAIERGEVPPPLPKASSRGAATAAGADDAKVELPDSADNNAGSDETETRDSTQSG